MKILQTADWHLGSPKSPYANGINLRSQDTLRCLDEMVRVAIEERPDYTLISGDIFDKAEIGQGRGHKEVLQARKVILELAEASRNVVVMRGTPNHDSAEAFEELAAHFEHRDNVHIVTTPQVLHLYGLDVAVLPGFDRGAFRAQHPGLSKDEENEVFTQELSNIVMGLRLQCRTDPDIPSVLMAHYTVPGANTESGQLMILSQFEPMLPAECLQAADFDLVALGHIHRPQQVPGVKNCFYSGAINAMTFGDEGQERGFWIHEHDLPFDTWNWESRFYKTPYREFITFHWTDTDITAINLGHLDEVAMNYWRWNGAVQGKIIRIRYSCSEEKAKAYRMKESLIEKTLLDDGAFMLWDNLPENIGESTNREKLEGTTDPEENLVRYLKEQQVDPQRIQELVLKARPIISRAEASATAATHTGVFEPLEISVKNYRNYADETFDFRDVTFCTINGQNGAGKSSLFMDAIIDCLFEEPREGIIKDETGKAPWLRNDENARSGSIMFTFRIGEDKYRVTRTRARSGKGTLNISHFEDGAWADRSKERYNDTQQEILNILGMDSFTFKSCALIMQDQYGIFLQAPPEDRVEVLSTLLCLGVYQAMERIADENRKAAADRARKINTEIEIHDNTVRDLGNPDGELKSCMAELEILEAHQKEKSAKRDKQQLLLNHQAEAQERRQKLIRSIVELENQKVAAEQNKASQEAIIESDTKLLSLKGEIIKAVEKYNKLSAQEKDLASQIVLAEAKNAEAARWANEVTAEQSHLLTLQEEAGKLEAQRDALRASDQDEQIIFRAQEYQRYSILYLHAKDLLANYQLASIKRDQLQYEYDKKKAYIKSQTAMLQKSKDDLEQRTALLENSGCPDPNNAQCRFLADALEAKRKIPDIDREMSHFREEQGALLEDFQLKIQEAEKAVQDIGFDQQKLLEYEAKVREYADAPEKLKALEEREKQIAVIEAKLDSARVNIESSQEKLSEVKLRAEEAKENADRFAGIHERHKKVIEDMDGLKPMLDLERQLPVAEERLNTAMKRLSEITQDFTRLDAEIAAKREEVAREYAALNDAGNLEAIVKGLNAELDNITAQVKQMQMRIGSLQEKADRVEKLRTEIMALSKQHAEASAEASDYEALKTAFSQSGVPHQIIRSIIPQLTDTANSILGQMTGGKMGVEFKLEKTLRSKKERATLDILVDEYGKPPLPYLSKSGGEKVKSSLAVILALAEIKSSLAGMQMGMLFIDEPPFLDSDGTQAYCDALETIWRRYPGIKIMAITHDANMKSRFPQSIDVVKTEDGSKIIY